MHHPVIMHLRIQRWATVMVLLSARVVSVGCTQPELSPNVEKTCSDGVAPAEGKPCEEGTSLCINGVDDDGDGRVDCAESACRLEPACASVAKSCTLLSDEGCTKGQSCYPSTTQLSGQLCAAPGMQPMGEACDVEADCAAHHHCLGHRCTRLCGDQEGCPRESACVRQSSGPGYCSLPCIPALGDAMCEPWTCSTVESSNFPYYSLPALALCAPARSGTLQEGQVCYDTALPQATSHLCGAALLCIPEAVSEAARGVCRATCALRDDGTIATACVDGARVCKRALPFDPRPPLAGALALGICQ